MSGIAVQPLMPDLTDGDFGEGKRQRPAAAGIDVYKRQRICSAAAVLAMIAP